MGDPCLELDTSLRDPGVSGPLMASFVPLALDVTENTDADAEVMDRYAVRGVPALVFLAADGRVVGRVTTALDPPQLAESITAAAAQLRH